MANNNWRDNLKMYDYHVKFMKEYDVPFEERDKYTSITCSIGKISYYKFSNTILLNGKKIPNEFFESQIKRDSKKGFYK